MRRLTMSEKLPNALLSSKRPSVTFLNVVEEGNSQARPGRPSWSCPTNPNADPSGEDLNASPKGRRRSITFEGDKTPSLSSFPSRGFRTKPNLPPPVYELQRRLCEVAHVTALPDTKEGTTEQHCLSSLLDSLANSDSGVPRGVPAVPSQQFLSFPSEDSLVEISLVRGDTQYHPLAVQTTAPPSPQYIQGSAQNDNLSHNNSNLHPEEYFSLCSNRLALEGGRDTSLSSWSTEETDSAQRRRAAQSYQYWQSGTNECLQSSPTIISFGFGLDLSSNTDVRPANDFSLMDRS